MAHNWYHSFLLACDCEFPRLTSITQYGNTVYIRIAMGGPVHKEISFQFQSQSVFKGYQGGEHVKSNCMPKIDFT